jgi:hypothetical protein
MNAPATTSTTKWFAVATTASAIATGIATAKPRTTQFRDARNNTIPTSRFQPAWKLGIAAYSFTSDGGSS